MKKRKNTLSINRETLLRLDSSSLRAVVGGTIAQTDCTDCGCTIIETQDSNCGCTGDPDSQLQCEESNNSACELIRC